MVAIEFENISKHYRLGLVSTKTLNHNIVPFQINHWFKAVTATIFIVISSSSAYGFDVVFRLDDPTFVKTDSIDRIIDLFIQKKVPLSIAVVACDEKERPIVSYDTSFIEQIQNGVFEICLHGMNHQMHDKNGEFSGIDECEARRRLEKAISVLSTYTTKQINTFIPPYNAIDAVSLKEIKRQCSILSSDLFTKAYFSGIDYYPETLGHMMDDNWVWCAASEILRAKHGSNDICVIMFHNYDLVKEDDWNSLSTLLDYCKTHKSITLHTFSSLQESGNHSSWIRLRANQLESGLKKVFMKKGILYPTWVCLLVHTINALIYAMLSFICITLLSLKRSLDIKYNIAFWGVALVSFVLAFFYLMGPLKLMVLVLIINIISMIIVFSKLNIGANSQISN